MTSITLKDKKYPADAPLIIENGVADSISLDGCENVIIRNMTLWPGVGRDAGASDYLTKEGRIRTCETKQWLLSVP